MPPIIIPCSNFARCTINPGNSPSNRERVNRKREVNERRSMDPPTYPTSTHSIRCPTCKTLITVAKLKRNTESAIRDATKAMTDDVGATPQSIRSLDADIAAMFHDGQPSQAIIDTNLRFGYAANVGLTTLLSYLINADVDSEDDVAKAGVAVQLVLNKCGSERAARDPVSVNCCAIAPRYRTLAQSSTTTCEARAENTPTTKKLRLASIGIPTVPKQALSATTEKPTESQLQPTSMRLLVARHFNRDDHTVTVRYAPVGSETDPVILPVGDASDPLTVPAEEKTHAPSTSKPVTEWVQPKPWIRFAANSPGPTDLTVPQPAAFMELPHVPPPTSPSETPHAV